MRQQIPADNNFKKFRQTTSKDQFLAEMGSNISGRELTEAIDPCYYKPE